MTTLVYDFIFSLQIPFIILILCLSVSVLLVSIGLFVRFIRR
jgi:hypothetical protein